MTRQKYISTGVSDDIEKSDPDNLETDSFNQWISTMPHGYQSGRSPKVVALFSATNFSSYIIE